MTTQLLHASSEQLIAPPVLPPADLGLVLIGLWACVVYLAISFTILRRR